MHKIVGLQGITDIRNSTAVTDESTKCWTMTCKILYMQFVHIYFPKLCYGQLLKLTCLFYSKTNLQHFLVSLLKEPLMFALNETTGGSTWRQANQYLSP